MKEWEQKYWENQSISTAQTIASDYFLVGRGLVPITGPYQSDSMNRKLAKAKEWLAASKWGKK